MSGHRIPGTHSKKEKQAPAHFWTDDEIRGHGRIKNGKYREKSMSQKIKLEKQLEELEQVGR